jgi:hypothetical protein
LELKKRSWWREPEPDRLEIDPEGWQRVRLRSVESRKLSIELLRPLSWFDDHGAILGRRIFIKLAEMNFEGEVTVEKILPCPRIEEGPGRLVTGRFSQERRGIWELKVEGDAEPIGVTPHHPLWSLDRHAWVSASELRPYERLATLTGPARLIYAIDTHIADPVYNIEVEGENCYRVGETGTLVHNASAIRQPFLLPSDSARTADYVAPGAALRGSSPVPSALYRGKRNLGALYFRPNSASTTQVRLPSTGFAIGTGSSSQHSEQQLIRMLPKTGCPVIVEVYTERWPCGSCFSVLDTHAEQNNSGFDIQIYFIAPAGDGTSNQSADDLRFSYENVFQLRWW